MIYSSDYSQIELRVLAHISNDEHLKAAFLEGQDIHASTAMRVLGLKKQKMSHQICVVKQKQSILGSFMAFLTMVYHKILGLQEKQRNSTLIRILRNILEVKEYMERIVREAKEQGFVETLYHRRRYLPDINSRNYNIRSFAERTAINTPIQGSAADILKIAMIELDKRLKEEKLSATMLLQVHDELVFEVPETELERLDKLVSEVMEHAVSLHVPLITDSSWGKRGMKRNS